MKKRAVMVRPAMEVGVESAEAGTGQRTGHKEGTVRLEPQRSRLSPKPGWRQRRQLRTTTKYRQIQEGFGTTDAETLLLMRLGDLQVADTGQSITAQPWSRSHVVVGLSARLAVGAHTEVTAPWLLDHRGGDTEVSIAEPGLVVFIDRRHLHPVESALAGRAEPVAPIAKAVDKYPQSPRPQEAAVSPSTVAVDSSRTSSIPVLHQS